MAQLNWTNLSAPSGEAPPEEEEEPFGGSVFLEAIEEAVAEYVAKW